MARLASGWFRAERKVLGTALTAEVREMGDDVCIVVSGGAEHVGCCVLSLPRPSLREGDAVSCTSSVLNVLGHKDDVICKLIAEAVCMRTGRKVMCSGGFHVDGIGGEGIEAVVEAARLIAAEIADAFMRC